MEFVVKPKALTQGLMEEVTDRGNLNQVDRQSQGVADRFAAGQQLPTRLGLLSANPQTGRRGASIGHPDGD